MLTPIMPDSSGSEQAEYHTLRYDRMDNRQTGRWIREQADGKDKVDELWQSVLDGNLTFDQASEALKRFCLEKDFHPVVTSKSIALLKKNKEGKPKVSGKAKATDKPSILEDQDIEQFRKSLEKRESTKAFDIASVLPEGLADAIKNDARVKNMSPSGFLAYLLPLALSLLPKETRIATPDGAFREPPVIYSAIIGDSGSGKTRIEKLCSTWFHKQQKKARRLYEEQMEVYDNQRLQRRKTDNSNSPPPPKLAAPRERKYLFNRATPESIAKKLGSQAKGSVWMRDELKGLICGVDQYKSNGDGTELILEYWDGGGFAVDRVDESNSFYAPEGNLSIVGGIQGKVFQSAFTDLDDAQGLAARFLFCQAQTLPMRRVTGGTLQLPEILSNIWSRLDQLPAIEIELDPDADRLFTDCFDQFEELAGGAQYEAVKAWCRKLPGQLLRVSAAIHLISWAYQDKGLLPRLIGPTAVLSAWRWLSHCHDSFTLLQEQIRGDSLSVLMDSVLRLGSKPGGVSIRDVYVVHLRKEFNNAAKGLGKQAADLAKDVCEELEANGYGYIKRVGKSDRFFAKEVA